MASLTTKTVEKIVRAGLAGMTNDGDGLYLKVGRSRGVSWIFRYKIAGKSREMGLGGSAEVSLAKAREKTAEARKLSKSGVDPLTHRDEALERQQLEKEAERLAQDTAKIRATPLQRRCSRLHCCPQGGLEKCQVCTAVGKHFGYLCVQGHR
ncbi:hypothetical protein EMIT0196MI5_120153 [Pseudomonas sp. IT-196MI5]|uniref:Arm DNA-binding domain-containing protein n=1 Tax=unclassified Pseudomonas TaxID=196821 RepID=UPI0039E1B1F1